MSAIVERIINGEAWWVDSQTGRTYGLCHVVPEDSARAKHARHLRARAAVKAGQPSESDIEQTCSEWLALDGWRSLKTDPVRNREWGKGFGELGMADRLYLRYNDGERLDPVSILMSRVTRLHGVMWIEWKSKSGRPSKHQTNWHIGERGRGALTLIAAIDFPASIEGFQNWYRASGLMRRKI